MRIAIMGATSQIAKDLIESYAAQSQHALVLYARRPRAVHEWLVGVNLAQRYSVHDFDAFGVNEHFDAIMNFVKCESIAGLSYAIDSRSPMNSAQCCRYTSFSHL